MTSKEEMFDVVVLGASSKLWRLARPFWNSLTTGQIRTHSPARDNLTNLPNCRVVIALWGVTSGTPVELSVNTELMQKAQDIATCVGADRVLHASTGAVYAPSDYILTERSNCTPRSPYGHAKLAAERSVIASLPRPVFLRLGNVAGADSLFASLSRRDPVKMDLFADGATPARSYVAPDDFSKLLFHLCQLPADQLPDVINVGGPRAVEMGDIVRERGHPLTLIDAPPEALRLQHLGTKVLETVFQAMPKSSDAAHLASFHYPNALRKPDAIDP